MPTLPSEASRRALRLSSPALALLLLLPLLGLGARCGSGPTPFTVFSDDFDDPNGTALAGKLPDIGDGKWTASGGPVVQSGVVDTVGGARTAHGSFEQALGAGDRLRLFITTSDTAGNFFSNGFAGISLLAGGSEKIFVGDPSGPSASWTLEESGVQSIATSATTESRSLRLHYTFDSGLLELFDVSSGFLAYLSASPGLAIDQLSIANDQGGDIAVDSLVAKIIPGPSTVIGFNDYPIVLAHGLFGTQTYEIGGIQVLDYWFGIEGAMQDEGAQVFVTSVNPIESSYIRGPGLIQQIEAILASTGASKVHLIGHSQGGLDARYVAGTRPDLVRSVTTVSTPNTGSGLAAFIDANIDSQGNVLAPLINFFGPIYTEFGRFITGSTDPLDWKAVAGFLGDLSQFNLDFPDGLPTGCNSGPSQVNGIHYYSWTGNIVGLFGVRLSTNGLDPTDSLLNAASLFYGLFEDNDGLVTVCSSKFGNVLGEYLMNHVDTINHITGLVSPVETSPLTLYRDHVDRLLDLPQ